nr:MAG TPA: hypothetical protein [Caudoviricetes sp.]
MRVLFPLSQEFLAFAPRFPFTGEEHDFFSHGGKD